MNRPEPTIHTKIGVIIVAYNSDEVLDDCITGVLLDPRVSAVAIVDNSSNTESNRIVAERARTDSRLRYIDPGANLGFAKGCNTGAKIVQGVTHYFFVNPDVRLARPLAPLVQHMEAEGSAIVTARLNSPTHPDSLNVRPLATRRRELMKALVGSRAYMPKSLSSTPDGNRISVGQVDGALLGISVDNFDAMGGFDERFELYYEDVDMCARAEPLGGCLYVSEDWGVHVGGASSSSVSSNAYLLGRVSRVRFLRKRYGNSLGVNLTIGAIAMVELLSRTLTNQAESLEVRVEAVGAQFKELRVPGSVRLLS
jgi:N-acetylglucosaminyl-diphospho-decaprenol L-rhamnosyltransferase